MINKDSLYNTMNYNNYINEQELADIIEACRRTIDWSVGMFFNALKKSIKFFAEKLVKDNRINSFYDGFTGLYLNHTDLTQLISELEDHINHEIIALQNKCLPTVKFTNIDVISSLEFLNELLGEQKATINLSQKVEKTVSQITAKAVSKFTPTFIPRQLSVKANMSLGKTISRALAVDTDCLCHHSKETVEKQLAGLLENIERDMKEQLKYQLAEQLYDWFDQYLMELSCPGKRA